MIERRKESRFRLSVPVKVSGIDDHGEPFAIEVMASSLSRSGALLTGLEVELRCGDMGAEVAIHKSNREPCPWVDLLPAEPVLSGATSKTQ